MKKVKVLFTGGSGLLGTEIKKLYPNFLYPSEEEFDVTNYSQMENYIKGKGIKTIFHAAAFISPFSVEKNPFKALEVNVIGTSNVVKLCFKDNLKMVYISTDYVFKGDKKNYSEEEPVFPLNKYAWSKLGGECAVRLLDNYLIIRTSFSSRQFPYEKAFVDEWTSKEPVDIIANKIKNLIDKNAKGTFHLGGKRRTIIQYAKSLSKKVLPISIKNADFKAPVDTSLNSNKYKKFIERKQKDL